MQPLPVDSILPEILAACGFKTIQIVQAPPGSGKTTRVAPYLLQHCSTLKDGLRKVYLLQPRRIAVQSVAARIAAENRWTIGEEVGYAIRFESRIGTKTQLLVATEGILLRKLSHDIAIQDVQMVIFDEFHERSMDSDLLLTMCRHLQATIRPDLQIIIMSATISTETLVARIHTASVHQTEGRSFPVSIQYHPINPRDRLTDRIAEFVVTALQRHAGDVLVFLPGKGEIFQTQSALASLQVRDAEILTLFGAMTMEQQSAAVASSSRRRVILATNVAETSLTIEGIRVVIDSGLARVMRFDPASGLDRLMLEPISCASADQRAGRAGRVAPGVAYRMWSQASHTARRAYLEPEIHRVDFSGAFLQLYKWQESDVAQLPWLDTPREHAVQGAALLLDRLGAINSQGITPLGIRMSQLPVHPRIGRLVLAGMQTESRPWIALAAALLSERDPFIRHQPANKSLHKQNSYSSMPHTATPLRWNCDIAERIHAIENFQNLHQPVSYFGEIHRNSLQTLLRVAAQIESEAINLFEGESTTTIADSSATSIALRRAFLKAFPDRVAKRRERGKDRALMVGGKGVKISSESGVAASEFFICLDVDGNNVDALVRKASTVEREWLQGENLTTRDELFYSPTHSAVLCRRRTYWLDLCIEETPAAISDHQQAAKILAKEAARDMKRFFPNDNIELNSLLGRIKLLSRIQSALDMPQIEDSFKLSVLEDLCGAVTRLQEIRNADWPASVRRRLSSEQVVALERLTPSRIKLSTGREVAVDYSQDQPFIAIKIQDAFGVRCNPTIADGAIVVQMHLLAPNQRPQQITNDLASFWQNGYPMVKKELKRRYAKHAWPDDPLA